MKTLDIILTVLALCAFATLAWAGPQCFQITPTSQCGTFEESEHTFDCGSIQNHPTWIITPGTVYSCTTNFEGGGFTGCQNNAGWFASSVKTTYWCENGVLKSSTVPWQLCLSAGLSGEPCDAEPEG